MTTPDGAAAEPRDGQPLPCGRDAIAVWQHAADAGVDEHEQDCPYCTAIREQYQSLAAAATEYTSLPITPPPGLIDSVMRTVLAELRPGKPIPLPSNTGTAYITDTALATALRTVLDRDQAVIARRCQIETALADVEHPPSHSEAGVPALTIRLSASVSYQHYTRHGDRLIRDRIIDAVTSLFGLHVSTIDIDIVDVFASSQDPA